MLSPMFLTVLVPTLCVLALLSFIPLLVLRERTLYHLWKVHDHEPFIFEECPSKSDNNSNERLLRFDRLEDLSGGKILNQRPPIKIMILIGQRIHATMMSRWIFHIYDAAKTLPHYTAYLWGEGYFGYNSVCKCTDSDGFESLALCPMANTDERPPGVPPLGVDVEDIISSLNALNKDVSRCDSLEIASFADHLDVIFGGAVYPFDAIVLTWPVGALKREEYFHGLNRWTALLFFELEWHQRSLEQYAAMKPDIVVTVFTDHVEENFPMRKFVRSLSNKEIWKSRRSPVKEGYYREFGPDTLFAYAPQSILPQCSRGWDNVVRDTAAPQHSQNLKGKSSKREVDILMVGNSGANYPTRMAFNTMVNSNIENIAKHTKVLPHPGYTELKKNARARFNPVEQFKDYMSVLENAKLCFVGIISTWSIRKYKEAMAAGCLPVGDVPADHYLSTYIVNVNITIPGYVNLDEDFDVAAANSASNNILGPISKWWCAGRACEKTLQEEMASDSWLLADLYSIQTNSREQANVAKALAEALLQVLDKYNRGEYDDLIMRAQRMVMTEYSWQQTLITRVEPAIAAWHKGERGWLRTPSYFLDSYKYSARHYFLLREWMLRRYGDEIAPAIRGLTYGALLREASRRLRKDNMESCLGALAIPTVCSDPLFDYFQNMTDFDVLFVQARGLYEQKYPLDGFSDRTPHHMRSLYRGNKKKP
eukprot:Lankesteria_metandrocarpae@DN5170_c0_g1_i4.p1